MPSARHRSLRRVTQRVALDSMMILGGSDDTSPESRAYVLDQLASLGADRCDAEGRRIRSPTRITGRRSATSRGISRTRRRTRRDRRQRRGAAVRDRGSRPGPPLGGRCRPEASSGQLSGCALNSARRSPSSGRSPVGSYAS